MNITTNSFITTRYNRFYFDNIESNILDIRDIAWSLSLQNRFNGHTTVPYNVADHSLKMAHYALNDLELSDEQSNIAARHALMHDATEAYIGDMVKPLKVLIPEFIEIEERLSKHINKTFAIDESMEDYVRWLDVSIIKNEMDALLWESPVERIALPAYNPFAALNWETCYEHFLGLARVLFIDNVPESV